jgi:HEAT repeat protein
MSNAAGALIEELAIPHRTRAAFWRLLALGPAALPAVREALNHSSALVRQHACLFLDHYVESEALNDLVAMLDDPDPEVRCSALHALACDRCKEGTCRPDEARVLPLAIRLMTSDSDAHVRAHAVGLVGQSAHRRLEAVEALLAVIASDPSPAVRKKARCVAPGGSIYKRTAPKTPRVLRHVRVGEQA